MYSFIVLENNQLDMSTATESFERVPESVEVQGYVIQGYVESAAEISESYGKRFRDQLADRGIEDVDPDKWYSAADAQDAFYETKEKIGSQTLINAGAKMAEVNEWPDHVTTVEDGLTTLDKNHQNTHRNTGDYDVGGYKVVHLDEGEARVDCTGVPYPSELGQGAIKGTIKFFQKNDSVVKISRVESEPGTVFEASW